MADLPISEENGQVPVTINDPITVLNSTNVKAASTAATAGDNALVVALSPNSPLPTGTNKIGQTGVAQASATSGQNGDLVQGAVTTAAPAYTTGQTSPLSLDTSGNLRVTFAASGEQNVNINQIDGVAAVVASAGILKVGIVGNTGAVLDAATSQNVATPANGISVMGEFNTTPTTLTSGNSSPLQLTSAARLIVDGSQVTQPVSGTFWQATQPVSLASTTITGTVAVTQSTSPWVVSLTSTTLTGTSTVAGNLTNNNAAPIADNLGVLSALANAAHPTWTEGDQVLLSENLTGDLRVISKTEDGVGNAITSTSVNSKIALDVTQAAPGLDRIGTGTLTALNSAVIANTQGCSMVTFYVSGTFALTYLWEGTVDGTNWVSVFAYDVSFGTVQGSNNAPNVMYSVACGSFEQVRMRASAYTSGTATVTWDSSQGTNVDHLITNDTNPISQSITVQDTATTSYVGANGQVIYNGTPAPTAGSVNSYSLISIQTVTLEVTGVWTGTLQTEISMDNGGSWYARPVHQAGLQISSATWTANFEGTVNVTGCTNFRIRAIAAMTGTATPVLVESKNLSSVYISNSILPGTNNIGVTGVAQGSTTAGEIGELVQGAVTTAAPTYTTGQTSPLSLTTVGALRTDNTSWLGSVAPTVGQKTMANSVPVVIASDQSAIPVNQGTANTIANAWPVKITDGTDTVAINTDGSLNVKQNPANLSVTATAATGVAVTATLPAVAADFHYITMIEIIKYATAAIAGSATPVLVTTTNFPTANVFTFGTAQAVGATLSYVYAPALPIRSAVVNTATTIVCPATPSVIWRVNVYYYAGV